MKFVSQVWTYGWIISLLLAFTYFKRISYIVAWIKKKVWKLEIFSSKDNSHISENAFKINRDIIWMQICLICYSSFISVGFHQPLLWLFNTPVYFVWCSRPICMGMVHRWWRCCHKLMRQFRNNNTEIAIVSDRREPTLWLHFCIESDTTGF